MGLYYLPSAARRWASELGRVTHRLHAAALQMSARAWLEASAALACSPEVLDTLQRHPETLALLPPAHAVVYHALHDLSRGREPSVRALVYGEPGAGKTTLGLYLVAAAYGTAAGLCDGTAGEVRERGESLEWAEPPLLDCRMAHSSPDPPPEWEWLARQAAATVEALAAAVRAYVESAAGGEPLRHWAMLLDEAGIGDLGTSAFWLARRRYAAASALAQMLRTGIPFVVMTAPSPFRVGRAARDVTGYRVYLAVPKRVIVASDAALLAGRARAAVRLPEGLSWLDVVSARVEVMSRKRAFSSLPPHLSAVAILAEGILPRAAFRQPQWFYARHLRARLERAELALRRAEENSGGGGRGRGRRRVEKTV
jgi:hypothetical protein